MLFHAVWINFIQYICIYKNPTLSKVMIFLLDFKIGENLNCMFIVSYPIRWINPGPFERPEYCILRAECKGRHPVLHNLVISLEKQVYNHTKSVQSSICISKLSYS
jgi:hypothetical protein